MTSLLRNHFVDSFLSGKKMNFINHWGANKCGLIYVIGDTQLPVPLKWVRLEVQVVDFIAEVSVMQNYQNEEDDPIEVHYSYPVEESAAIVGFEAVINNRHVVATVKDKETAQKEYDKAINVSRIDVVIDSR